VSVGYISGTLRDDVLKRARFCFELWCVSADECAGCEGGSKMNVALWIVQVLLAFAFSMVGGTHQRPRGHGGASRDMGVGGI
jgi:hypothetical protein